VKGVDGTGAVVAFELRRRWHGARFRLAVLLVALASLTLGLAIRPGWLDLRGAASLYRYVYLVCLALVFRFDLAHDAEHGFADFIAPNLVGTGAYVAARLAAGLAGLLQFALVAAPLTALAPVLDIRFALWNGAFWILLATLFSPAVAAAESALKTRLPVLAVALLTIIAILVAAGLGVGEALLSALGTRGATYGAFASLDDLAWRAAVVGLGGLALIHPLLLRHWRAR
jgi:hypothetical protein